MNTYTQTLEKLMRRQSLSRAESRDAVQELMAGAWTPVQIAGFLTALRTKGEEPDEVAGAVEAMRAAALPLKGKADLIVDTCGTGGDNTGSFNLSTAAAIIVAGAGFTVAKHGNRSISSRSGSADVLEALGIPLQAEREVIESCLNDVGLAFLFAPAFHPATRHAMPVRKELGVRTLFNLLGPLTNPARPQVQLIGVYDPYWVRLVALVLIELGCQEGVVVHGMGHDEIVVCGETQVCEIVGGSLREGVWRPEDFGVDCQPLEKLPGGSPQENAQRMNELLAGQPSAYAQAACLNAAALIRAATRQRTQGREKISLPAAYEIATLSVTSGRAREKLQALKELLTQKAHD